MSSPVAPPPHAPAALPVRAATGLYELFLRFFPPAFRRRFAAEIASAFTLDAVRAHRTGFGTLARTTLRACADAARSGLIERLEQAGLRRPTPSRSPRSRPPVFPAAGPIRWTPSGSTYASPSGR